MVRGFGFVHIINVILYFREGEDFVGAPLSCPPSPWQAACLQHLHTPSLPMTSSSTLCSSPFFDIYSCKTSECSAPLSPPSNCSLSYFSLIPSHGLSPPLYPSIADLSSTPLHRSSPAILWHFYPLIPNLSVPDFTPTHRLPLWFPSASYPFCLLVHSFFSPLKFALPPPVLFAL